MKPKSRRYKVECCVCGSVFNNDYKDCHEKKVHGGKNVRVKTIGAPENVFIAAKRARFSEEAFSSVQMSGPTVIITTYYYLSMLTIILFY